MNLGYACINMHLREHEDVWTGRSLIKRTYNEKGLEYVSKLVLENASHLPRIIEWNHENGIDFFRMSCNIFPFIDWYEFEDLPDFDQIKSHLRRAGDLAKSYSQRVTQHPDHFVKLASPNNDELVEKSVKTLTQQARVFDLMGLERSYYNAINIHVGGAYGDKPATGERFASVVRSLPESVRSRLTVENDDKSAMYTVRELNDYVRPHVDIPIVFDSLHYRCYPGDQTYEEALRMAVSTWPDDVTPIVHHSNSRKEYEDDSSTINGHTDYYYTPFETIETNVDIMLESKMKEQALLDYRKKFVETEQLV